MRGRHAPAVTGAGVPDVGLVAVDLSQRAVRPIRSITAVAAEISASTSHGAIDTPGTKTNWVGLPSSSTILSPASKRPSSSRSDSPRRLAVAHATGRHPHPRAIGPGPRAFARRIPQYV